MSAIRSEVTSVLSMRLVLEDLSCAARRLDLLARGGGEGVGVHGERLGQLPAAEHLHRHVPARGQAGRGQRLRRDLGALLEALLEVVQVHGLGGGAEPLEGHRLLHVRALELAHPHVDGHLPALEVGPAFRARARARALVAAAGGLAHARSLAPADALAPVGGTLGGLEIVQALQLFGHHFTSTRCETELISPRTASFSERSALLPMRPTPSVRSVARWRLEEPLEERTWVIVSFLAAIRRSPAPAAPRGRRRSAGSHRRPGPAPAPP